MEQSKCGSDGCQNDATEYVQDVEDIHGARLHLCVVCCERYINELWSELFEPDPA